MKSKSLAELKPELLMAWHPVKNGDLTPHDITAGSNKLVWWVCSKNIKHEWQSSPKRIGRISKKCPFCSFLSVCEDNCLAITNKNLTLEWNNLKNGVLTPNDVTKISNKLVWWKCLKNGAHEWEASVNLRVLGKGCPICTGKKVDDSNSLASIDPLLVLEWHPQKNGSLTPHNVTKASTKKVWWLCPVDSKHEWEARIGNRHNRKSKCPYCFGHSKLTKEKSLAVRFPKIATEWHPTKNFPVTPNDVSYGSQKRYWWLCLNGHEWETKVGTRVRHNCPVCAGLKVSESTSLAFLRPEIAKEWHNKKNEPDTPHEVAANSNKRFWWQCQINEAHEWKVSVSARTRVKSKKSSNCPKCYPQGISDPENRVAAELETILPDLIIKQSDREILEIKGSEADIHIPLLKLVIEIDGAYFHQNIDRDKKKRMLLEEAGYRAINLRDKGLEKMSNTDVSFSSKNITLDVIQELVKTISIICADLLNNEQKNNINLYLSRDSFINESGYQLKSSSKAGDLSNSNLATSNLPFVKEWHPSKNGENRPEHFTKSSGNLVCMVVMCKK